MSTLFGLNENLKVDAAEIGNDHDEIVVRSNDLPAVASGSKSQCAVLGANFTGIFS